MKVLKDERDLPFLKHIFILGFLFLPLALFIYSLETIPWWIRVPYWAFLIFLLGPHLLMLHNVCHRNPWKKNLQTPLKYFLEFAGLFFGLPPRLYYYHHIHMHHKEGNGPDDLSSTEDYQRDSFIGWLHYFFRFIFLGPIEIPLYFFKRNKSKFGSIVVLGYISFYTLLGLATWYNPTGAIVVFIVPTLITWFGLMGGNWAQHAFVDSQDPDDPIKNSIALVECTYNKRCFNDGYHIGHHLSPGMHWTEMPDAFNKNLEKYYQGNALIFKTLDYQIIWLLLMLKRHNFLAKFYVAKKSDGLKSEEVVSLIKERLLPVTRKHVNA